MALPATTFRALLFAPLAVGCDAPATAAPATDLAPSHEVSALAPTPAALRETDARRSKRAPKPRPIPQLIAWPDASAIDAGARALFTEGGQHTLDTADLPVMAPRDARAFGGTTHILVKPTWYTIALKDADYAQELSDRQAGRAPSAPAGIGVFIQGNRTKFAYDNIKSAKGTRLIHGQPAWITQNEAIWSATWEEHGATYVVELECSRPGDARCATDAVLVAIAESTAFVGGLGSPLPPKRRDQGGAP